MGKDLPFESICRGLGHRKYVEDLPLDKTLLSISQGGMLRTRSPKICGGLASR